MHPPQAEIISLLFIVEELHTCHCSRFNYSKILIRKVLDCDVKLFRCFTSMYMIVSKCRTICTDG